MDLMGESHAERLAGPWRTVAVLLMALLAALTVGGTASAAGFDRLESELQEGRYAPMPVNLPDGRILIVGGVTAWTKGPPFASAEVDSFDPVSRAFTSLAPLQQPRYGVEPIVLGDGRVLIVGGEQWFQAVTAEVMDPDSGESRLIELGEDMPQDLTPAPLPDGRVLIFGGREMWYDAEIEQILAIAQSSAWILDPETGSLEEIEDMPVAVASGKQIALPDGRVLIVGGRGSSGQYVDRLMIFDPATKRFALAGAVRSPRSGATLTLLENGKVLIAGGAVASDDGNRYLRNAEIFDPATGSSAPTGRTTITRFNAEAVRLSDGRVLIAGGIGPVSYGSRRPILRLRGSEIYDPRTGAFKATGGLVEPRAYMAMAPMPGARALVAGGIRFEEGYQYGVSSAEIHNPDKPIARVHRIRAWSKSPVVRIGKRFTFYLEIKNSGKAASRATRLCTTLTSWAFFDELDCPTVNLRPGKKRIYAIRGIFSDPRGSYAKRPLVPGKFRRIDVCAIGQDVNACTKVTVKIKR